MSGVHSSRVSAGGQTLPAGAGNQSYHASAGGHSSPSGGDTASSVVGGGSGRTRSGSDGGVVAVRLEATGGETNGNETDCTTQVTNTRTRSGEQTNLSQRQQKNRKRK